MCSPSPLVKKSFQEQDREIVTAFMLIMLRRGTGKLFHNISLYPMATATGLGLMIANGTQVTGVFARRGYNVQSLAVGNSEVEGQSRITMVIPGSAEGTSKIIKQLNKLVHVQQVCSMSAIHSSHLTHAGHV